DKEHSSEQHKPGSKHDHQHDTRQEREDELFDSQLLNQFTTDYGAWGSPFDIEAERLEQIIRDSGSDRPSQRSDRDDPEEREDQEDREQIELDRIDGDADAWRQKDREALGSNRDLEANRGPNRTDR